MSVLQRLSKVALLLAACGVAPAPAQEFLPQENQETVSRSLSSDGRRRRPGYGDGRRRRRRSEPIQNRGEPGRRRGQEGFVGDGRRRRGVEVEPSEDYGRRRRRRDRRRRPAIVTKTTDDDDNDNDDAGGRRRRKSQSKRPSGKTVVEHHGKLKVKNGKIVNQYGDPVQLTGVSLFWSQWSDYYTKGAVRTLADDWKVSVIRAAMGVIRDGGYLTSSRAERKEREKIETVVDEAIAQGIYVIIDWHIDGGDAMSVIKDCKDIFTDMGRKYGRYDNVLWEPYNEPHRDTDWSDEIKPYHEKIIPVIRKYSDNIIMLGSQSWSQDVDEAAEDPVFHRDSKYGHNLVYSLHFYAVNHQKKYRKKAIKAIENGLTLFANEWGVCAHYGGSYGEVDWDEVDEWLELFDKYQIGNTHWAVNDNDREACSLLRKNSNEDGGWGSSSLTKTGRKIRDYTRKHEL